MNPILNSLKSRLAWYEKALAMITGDSPWENGFGWPIIPGIPLPIGSAREVYLDQYIMFLAGCIRELRNTIDMMESSIRKSQNKIPNRNCGYQPNDAKYPAHPPTSDSIVRKGGIKP